MQQMRTRILGNDNENEEVERITELAGKYTAQRRA